MTAEWLREAIFYEIYPQSFYDSNGDGIGDFQGIIEKLDYIRALGCSALWLNPCYDSPFRDAGYDVRDYTKTAARYGTNDDLYRLFREAHARGMRVLLDLVPGHTSEEHRWFRESGRAERNAYSDRYIWTDGWLRGMAGHPYIGGECERDGTYMLNFFKCQPALNYGFHTPRESWQQGIDDAGPTATREAIVEVMRFWLSHGADGFRVDMADSLVKDDDAEKSATCETWRRMFAVIRAEYPEAVFVSEWGDPRRALNGAGFDMDFLLDHEGRGYKTLMRDSGGRSYFRCGAGGEIRRFLEDYLGCLDGTRGNGYLALITGNHDTPRASATLSPRECRLAYATLFTLPGVPFLYYGDEIGMRYQSGLRTKEGGYTRTGTRTPMQWTEGANKGFSTAEPEALYLPVDTEAGAPSVETAERDTDSLYHTVRRVLALRQQYEALWADGSLDVLCDQRDLPFVYRRGSLLIAVNPAGEERAAALEGEIEKEPRTGNARELYTIGSAGYEAGRLTMGAQSYGIWELYE